MWLLTIDCDSCLDSRYELNMSWLLISERFLEDKGFFDIGGTALLASCRARVPFSMNLVRLLTAVPQRQGMSG